MHEMTVWSIQTDTNLLYCHYSWKKDLGRMANPSNEIAVIKHYEVDEQNVGYD